MSSIAALISSLLNLYVLILIARLVLEYVAIFARDWRPKGPLLLLSETVFTLTDPTASDDELELKVSITKA